MSYGFTLNEKHSREFGIFVRTLSHPTLPPIRASRASIRGRPGDLVFEDAPENKLITLLCSTAGSVSGRRDAARRIAAWLSGSAYSGLAFDYEPDKTFTVVSAVSDVSSFIGNGLDEFQIIFECEPYQLGQEREEYGSGSLTLENGGTAPSETVITVNGSGNVAVSCAGMSFTLSGMSGSITLDSKRMIVYSGTINRAGLHGGGFIRIPPGEHTMTVTGSASVIVRYRDTWM